MAAATGHPNRVIARYLDGRLVRGFTLDFFPNQKMFHVCASETIHDVGQEVMLADLKAVYYVKDLKGNPNRPEPTPVEQLVLPPSTRGIIVKFKDGELLLAATSGYSAARDGFFVIPLEPTNNERIYVMRAATETVRVLLPTEKLVDVVPAFKAGK